MPKTLMKTVPRAQAPSGRDFLDLDRVDAAEIRAILALAHRLKKAPLAFRPMDGKTLALIFEKPSTRTRVSFEVGMRQLGGQVTTLSGAEIQLGRGETVADTGRVLSRYVDLIMLRTFAAHKLFELAEGASVPVINGLTDHSHPCQVMADVMTAEERLGDLKGKTVVWSGDGDNNVIVSWMHAAPVFGFELRILCPPEFAPPADLLAACQKRGARITVAHETEAGANADIVLTDCWVSMHNADAAVRQERLASYRVDAAFMRRAKPTAIFMHCLPAHRGEEVADDVIDGPQSAVWDEAENRLHAQKAIMCWCLGIAPG
ncbi:MAG TPA: ornithine carbamoyltransferase [Alphaproteobacteria bacterium]|nr:ornithine carbamoyltransferase [Alphaproteobacteria bacterium]